MKCALFQCRRVTHIAHRASNKQMLEVRKKKNVALGGEWKNGGKRARGTRAAWNTNSRN